MNKKDDGGPAFPVSLPIEAPSGRKIDVPFRGMSLRDWFAGQALVALGTTNPNLPGDPASTRDWPGSLDLAKRQAAFAYLVADVMIASRTGDANG